MQTRVSAFIWPRTTKTCLHFWSQNADRTILTLCIFVVVWLSVGKTMTRQRIPSIDDETLCLNGMGSRVMPFEWNSSALRHYIPPPTCWATESSGHCLFILALGQWESMNDHKTTPTTDDGNRWIMALIYSRNANTSSEVCHVMNQTTPAFIMHRFVVKYSMRITNISDTWYGLLCLFFLT